MSGAASVIAAAEDALLAALLADATLGAIEGKPQLLEPGEAQLRTEHVWISPPADTEELAELTSDGEERYLRFPLEVVCYAQASGGDYQARRDRSAELADAVEAVVLADRTLGGVLEDAQVTQLGRGMLELYKAIGIAHTITISAEARFSAP